MEESAVYLKYSGQGFAHDAIALWVLVKAIVVLPDHLYCMRMVVLLVNNEMLGFLSQPNLWLSRLLALFGFAFVSFSSVCFFNARHPENRAQRQNYLFNRYLAV